MKISAVVLTKNEEKNIERCLQSLSFCNEIVVIDDYSIDGTLRKIINFKNGFKKKGVEIKVLQRHLNGNFSDQRNFGLNQAKGDWLLFVDADEEISSPLIQEIKNEIYLTNEKKLKRQIEQKNIIVAYYIKRRDFFWGREVRFGDINLVKKIGLIRLVRKNFGWWEGLVHERLKIKNRNLKIKFLKNYINHYPHQNVKEFLKEINFYSSLRAEELFRANKKTNILEIVLYPLGKFIINYFFRLGFLDGAVGFVYAFMMSFYSFLVRTKLYLKEKSFYLNKRLWD